MATDEEVAAACSATDDSDQLNGWDYAVIAIYFIIVLGIGLGVKFHNFYVFLQLISAIF